MKTFYIFLSLLSYILAASTKPISYGISTTPIITGSNPGAECSTWTSCNTCASNQCEWTYSDQSNYHGSCTGAKSSGKPSQISEMFERAKICRHNDQCLVSNCESEGWLKKPNATKSELQKLYNGMEKKSKCYGF